MSVLARSRPRFLRKPFMRNFSPEDTRLSPIEGAEHHANPKLWRNIFYFVSIPALTICGLHCYNRHVNHPHERPEFKKYDFMRIRNRKFPWGDGNHTFFHNPHTNALPDGYEV